MVDKKKENNGDPDVLIGMKEICDFMNRSETTILKMIRELDFPAKPVGGIYEADKKEIKKWRKKILGDEKEKSLTV